MNLLANDKKDQVEVHRVNMVLGPAQCALVLWPWRRWEKHVCATDLPFPGGKSPNQQPGRGRLDKPHERLGLFLHLCSPPCSWLLRGLQDEGRGDGQKAHSQKVLA